MQPQLLLLICASLGAATQIRGVAPQDQHLYVPDSEGFFSCLSDPSIRIPFDRVNDDYCDCPDGSDEPGTAACSNGKFWCAGSEQYLPSRIVGDGACDYEQCCDGSDEAPGLCPDRCAEVKAVQAAKIEAELDFLRQGVEMRNEMVSRAQMRKQQLGDQVAELSTKVSMLKKELAQGQEELILAERADQESSEDMESVQVIGELRNAIRITEADLSEISDRFNQLKDSYRILEAALRQMSIDYNPNFNDPAVKEAIKVWRDAGTPDLRLPTIHRDYIADLELLDKIKVASTDEVASKPAKSGTWSYYVKNLLPPFVSNGLTQFLGGGLVLDNPPKSGGVRAQKVQQYIQELQDSLKNAEKDLTLNQKLLSLGEEFWGPDEIGRSAENLCVSAQRGDFNYEACLFGTAVQLDGSRYSVQLGRSTGLKESEDGQLSIKFVEGNQCPNGVMRTLTLLLECGHTTEAIFVEETDVCQYTMSAKSPIACKLPETNTEIIHGEL